MKTAPELDSLKSTQRDSVLWFTSVRGESSVSQALAQLSSIFVFAPNICRGRKYSNTEQFECRSTLVIESEGSNTVSDGGNENLSRSHIRHGHIQGEHA